MASVTFNNCTVHIGQQVNEGGTGNYYDFGPDSPAKRLPAALATDKAMTLWHIAQQEGWIDREFQPIVSNAKASILADAIGAKLNLTERWKPFTELWNINDLYKVFDKAISAPGTSEFITLVRQKITQAEL